MKKSGIHIKKSHKGRFTAWAKSHGFSGVTSEAIAAGKNSKSASVRKQATFAANTRKWKHADGGLIKRYDQWSVIDQGRYGDYNITPDSYDPRGPLWTGAKAANYAANPYGEADMMNRLGPSSGQPNGSSGLPSVPDYYSNVRSMFNSAQSNLDAANQPPADWKGTPWRMGAAGDYPGKKEGQGFFNNPYAVAGINNIGNLYQLGNAVFNRENTTAVNNPYQRKSLDMLHGRRYNVNPQLEQNRTSYGTAAYNLRNSGAVNGSEMRSRLTDLLRQKYAADSAAFATKQNADNQYIGEEAQAYNAAGEANRAEGVRVQTANEQNRAARQTAIASSLGSIGRNVMEQRNDSIRTNLLPVLFPGLGNSGEDIIKQLMKSRTGQ